MKTQVIDQGFSICHSRLKQIEVVQVGPEFRQSLLEKGLWPNLEQSLSPLGGVQLHVRDLKLYVPDEGMIRLGIGAEDSGPTRDDFLPQPCWGIVQHDQIHMIIP